MRSWRRSRCAYPAFGGVLFSCLVALTGSHAAGAPGDDDLDFLTSVLLTSEAAETRTNAALRLLRLGAPKADLVLAEALRSGDAEMARVVALALTGNGRPPQVVAEALVDALEDGTEGIGALVGRTLATIGEAQIPQILQVAQSDDSTPAARIAAVEALGAFRSKAALEPLIAVKAEST